MSKTRTPPLWNTPLLGIQCFSLLKMPLLYYKMVFRPSSQVPCQCPANTNGCVSVLCCITDARYLHADVDVHSSTRETI